MSEHIGEVSGAGIGVLHALLVAPYSQALETLVSTVSLALLGGIAGGAGQYIFKKVIEKYHEKH